jgi:hypothetical protein
MPTGLPTLMNNIGMVKVVRRAATEALDPHGTSSCAPR